MKQENQPKKTFTQLSKEEQQKKDTEDYFNILYDWLSLMLATRTFHSWSGFWRTNKITDFVLGKFKVWVKENKPAMFQTIDKLLHLSKEDKKWELAIRKAESIIDSIDVNWMIKELKNAIEEKVRDSAWVKIQAILDSMETDIMTTKTMLIQSAIVGISAYFTSIKQRAVAWEKISSAELKQLYDILKVELWESTQIKETRVKTSNVTIQIPIDPAEIQKIIEKDNRMDIAINYDDIPEINKKKLWNILPTFNTQNGSKWHSEQVWATTQTENVSDSYPV